MAGRRRPATSAKNNEASRRSFAFVIKAASSLLTSFSTYVWMDRTLLPIMRRDAVQMVSSIVSAMGTCRVSMCCELMLRFKHIIQIIQLPTLNHSCFPTFVAFAPGPPRPDGNHRGTNSNRFSHNLHMQCHDNAYHYMLCRINTCWGGNNTTTCRPSTKHPCIDASLIVESAAVAHCSGTWNRIAGFDGILGGDTLRCIAVGRHTTHDSGLGLRRIAGNWTVTHI